MTTPRRRLQTIRVVLAMAALVAACGSPQPAAEAEPWGTEAAAFIDGLAEAYTANDSYGVLDFYQPAAVIEKWRADNRGGFRVRDLLRWNSGDLAHEVEALYLGDDAALAVVRWPSNGELGVTISTIEDSLISGEAVYDLGALLAISLRASPEVITTYEELAAAYAVVRSENGEETRNELYADGAVVTDGLSPVAFDPELPGDWRLLPAFEVAGDTAPKDAPAVYLGAAEYGRDPMQAVAVYAVTTEAGCEHRVAVRWQVEAGKITHEQHYQDVESFPRCAASLPSGWWSGISLPGPADQTVTGAIVTAGGEQVEVYNGTPLLEDLVQWGLRRFVAADLPEPRFDSVIFEPSRRCESRTGRVLDDGVKRELFVCMYATEVCDGADECAVASTAARVAILHELGHAWMIDHVDADTQSQLLELAGRSSWNDLDLPWVERGVEYAAETLAWGLIDQNIAMVRIGAPSCEVLGSTFQLLTAASSLRAEAECPGL